MSLKRFLVALAFVVGLGVSAAATSTHASPGGTSEAFRTRPCITCWSS